MSKTTHRGRGLHERILSAIEASPHLARNAIQTETEEGRVTLRGRVSSYFQKQMAQESIRRVDGVEQIDNLLEVYWA